jgi:predicted metal-dependent peptidase
MNVNERIKKAHVAIMQHNKFCAYSGVLSCGNVEVTESVSTACTDGWDVKYNPTFIAEHMPTDPELRFLVLHEATHKAYRHLSIWRGLHDINAQLANIAADYFVNGILVDTDAGEGFIKMPDCGVQPKPEYKGLSVLQIFNDLMQDPENGGGGGSMDDHDWDGEQQSEAEQQKRIDEINRALRQGEMLRKKRSESGSGSQDGMFGDVLAPKVDWRKVLREFIQETCAGRDESSWARPNRRFLSEDIYMPTMLGTTMSELVIGFDTSGSCFGGAEMTRFVSEITTIINDVKPSKTHVIYWDTKVAGHQTFEDGQFAVQELKPKGGGGTNGAVLFDYLRKKRISPQAIVQFSDGYVGDWGRSDCPTLWALTGSMQAAFGTTIHLEV